MITCEICGGELLPLGKLGDRLHLRCRSCHAPASIDVERDGDQISPEQWEECFGCEDVPALDPDSGFPVFSDTPSEDEDDGGDW